MHFLVTRPIDDADGLADKLRLRGHKVTVDPLLSIEFYPEAPVTRTGLQALLVTSANGLRAVLGRSDFPEWLKLPLFAVGPTTAAMARQAGFVHVYEASGDVVALTQLVKQELATDGGPLLHIAGTVSAGDLKGALKTEGFWVERVVLYEARAAEALSPETVEGLRGGAIRAVLLYSKRSAEIFADLCAQAGLQSALFKVNAYCLSANAAAPLQGVGLQAIHIASAPNETDLLALID